LRGNQLLAQRIVLRQHEMYPRRQHPVDIGDCASQFLAERIDHPRALLYRRRNEALLLESLAERGEILLGQAVVVEDTDSLGEMSLVDRNSEAAGLADGAFRRDAAAQQGRGDHVGLMLIEVAVKLGLAGGQQAGAEHRCRKVRQPAARTRSSHVPAPAHISPRSTAP
jgi:hypothetical protein